MKKFMVLYMAPRAAFEQMMKSATPEQRQKGMQAWMQWMGANQASMIDGGGPLGKTKRVDANGTTDTKNEIGGYSIVQAETQDAAAKIFGKDHPHLQMMPGAGSRLRRSCRCRGCEGGRVRSMNFRHIRFLFRLDPCSTLLNIAVSQGAY